MEKLNREIVELEEKIRFCELMIKYGNLVNATSEQAAKAFKVMGNLEEELRVLKMRATGM